MSMVPLASGTIRQREPGWISLTMILAVVVGLIALCIYAV